MLTLAIPNYNGARFLAETLESLERNKPYVRWMLQDAGSSDASLTIARRFAGSFGDIVVETDGGQADGLNRAFSRMGGDVLGFLNSDDCLADGAAEAVLAEFENDPDLDLVYGEVDWINENGAVTGHHAGRISTVREVLDIYGVWWNRRQWVQPEVFWRRSFGERVGPFDTRYNLAFDYDYWVRCFLAKAKVKKIPRTLARFRIHRGQKSRDSLQAANEIRDIAGDALKLCETNPGHRNVERMIRFDRYQSGQDYWDQGSRPSLASMVVRQPDWLLLPAVRERAYDSLRRRFTKKSTPDGRAIDR
jgi:glycosyltransferase involved in cell wall biosynthesis